MTNAIQEQSVDWASLYLRRGDYRFDSGENAGKLCKSGWYWVVLDSNNGWGCEPYGPFKTEAEARKDAIYSIN